MTVCENSRGVVACSYEDRKTHQIGLKVLCATMHRYSPSIPLKIATTSQDGELDAWLSRYKRCEQIRLVDGAGCGWDVKPTLLLQLLDEGWERVLWIDADIAANGDVLQLVPEDPNIFVASEPVPAAPNDSSAESTKALGLEIGREMPIVNSCFLHVSSSHRALLEDWAQCQQLEAYQEAQRKPPKQRPSYFVSDQDVLRGVLGSRKHAHVKVQRIRCGRDIVHCLGVRNYRIRDRLLNIGRGMPKLIHAHGPKKPWFEGHSEASQLQPYDYVVRSVADLMDGEEISWARVTSAKRRMFYWLTCRSPNLGGLPSALQTFGVDVLRRFGSRN